MYVAETPAAFATSPTVHSTTTLRPRYRVIARRSTVLDLGGRHVAKVADPQLTEVLMATTSPTVAALFDEWHAVKRPTIRPASARVYSKVAASLILPALGARPVRDLTTTAVAEAFQAQLAAGRALASIKSGANVLRQLGDFAVDRGLLPANPVPAACRVLRGRRLQPFRRPAVRGDVLAQLRETLRTHHRNPAYVLLLDILAATGMRPGEACALRVGDLDLAAGRCWIRHAWSLDDPDGPTKSGKERLVGLPPALVTLLRAWVGARGPETWVFPSSRGRLPLRPWALATAFRRARKRLGLERPYSPHGCRHGVATRLLEGGRTLWEVQMLLGHSSPSVTLGYATEARPDLDALAATLAGGAPATPPPATPTNVIPLRPRAEPEPAPLPSMGPVLATLRGSLALTRAGFAAACGVDLATATRWEEESIIPEHEVDARIYPFCDRFDVELPACGGWETYGQKYDEDVQGWPLTRLLADMRRVLVLTRAQVAAAAGVAVGIVDRWETTGVLRNLREWSALRRFMEPHGIVFVRDGVPWNGAAALPARR